MIDDPGGLIDEFAVRLASADVAFGHGTDNASDEARRLVADALWAQPGLGVDGLRALLERRIVERVPAPYLTGVAWFGGRRFKVTPGVMIPRSPIAEVLAQRVEPWLAAEPERVLDLCCGCGAIGIAAAHAFPSADIDLVDVDSRAIALAQQNIRRHGVAGRVRAIESDLLASVPTRCYDLILANPPYVPAAEMRTLPAEFRHEPRRGLLGGADGLDVWRRIVAMLNTRLAIGGVLVGEVGNCSAAFAAAFPTLGAVWPVLDKAEAQADGSFGVFVSVRR